MPMFILLRSGLSMKNLLLKIATLMLAVSLCLVAFGCGNSDADETIQKTGEYKYRIATGTRDVLDENGEVVLDEDGNATQESYKYYIITGYQVSSDDALKMASGDFSTIKEEHRNIAIPKTGRDLKEENDYPVEEIEAGAFTNQIILTNVKVGSNIKSIGEGAFAGCTNLKSLALPFVGESKDATGSARVFGHLFGSSSTSEDCVEITAKLTERKDDAGASILTESTVTFKVPNSLEEVDLSSSDMVNVSECAFYGMTMLKKVIIPETVTEIDSHAFYGCSALTSFDLKKVKTIYESGFASCTSLKDVNFKDSVVEVIKKSAFEGCTNLGTKRFIDETTNDAEALLTIKLPSTVKELGKNAFKGCSGIKYFDMKGTGVQLIDNSTFAECFALIKISINDDTVIKAGAFANCSELAIDTDSDNKKDSYNVVGTYVAEVGAFDSLK